LEATRGEAVKATPSSTQDNASTNHFAALISDDEGDDNEEDNDSGDDGGIGAVTGTGQAAGTGQQQPGAPRLQQELRQLAGYNNDPAHDNNNGQAGILGRTRQATKSVRFAVANIVAAPKDDALLYKDPANDQEAL
jgi:hypothetical protein